MALDCIVSHPGGGEGIIHLTEPNGEETRPGLEVGDANGEDVFHVVVASLFMSAICAICLQSCGY